jgi:hypothetical protein
MPQGALTTSPLRRARPYAQPFPPLFVTLQVDVSLGGSTGFLESNTACPEASVAAETVPRPHSASNQLPSCDQAARGVGVTSSPSLGREADEPTSGLRVRRHDDKLPSTAYAANDPPMQSSEPVYTDTDDLESSRPRPEARAKGEPTWYIHIDLRSTPQQQHGAGPLAGRSFGWTARHGRWNIAHALRTQSAVPILCAMSRRSSRRDSPKSNS